MIQQKYGGLKIIWHPEKLTALKDGVVTAPLCSRIKPTNMCNHKCFYCSYDPDAESVNILSENFKRTDEIPYEKMMEILDDFKDIGVKCVTFSGGGEPLIYPHIIPTFKKVVENGLGLSIITNGQKLNGERAEYLKNADWVRISLDACRPETFSKNRDRPKEWFDELINNIRNFVKMKSPDCELGINFVVHHLNKDEVYEAAKFFKELGVNHVKFTPRWIDKKGEWLKYHEPFKEYVIDQIKRAKQELVGEGFDIFDTYENDFKLTGVPKRTYSTCPRMQIVSIIGADCIVYFCQDKAYTKRGALGSIKEQSFKDLWFSEQAKEIFKNFNPKIECQQHCTNDARNILVINAIKNYGKHVNYI